MVSRYECKIPTIVYHTTLCFSTPCASTSWGFLLLRALRSLREKRTFEWGLHLTQLPGQIHLPGRLRCWFARISSIQLGDTRNAGTINSMFLARPPPSIHPSILHVLIYLTFPPDGFTGQNNADAVRQYRAEVLQRMASEFAVMWESEEEVRCQRRRENVQVRTVKNTLQRSGNNT